MKIFVILLAVALMSTVAYAGDSKEQTTEKDKPMLVAYEQNYCFQCVVRTYSSTNQFFVAAPSQYAADEYARGIAAQSGSILIGVACQQVASGCN